MDYIETCVDELNRRFPAAPIVIGGDFNQLPDEDLVERTRVTQMGSVSALDRVFVSCPSRDVCRQERPSSRRGVR